MKLRYLFVITFIALFSLQAKASQVRAQIQYILPHPGEVVFVNLVGVTIEDINSQGTNGNCITSRTGYFRVDLTSETGAAIFATLLTAQAQGKPILIKGNDTCFSGRENVSWVLLSS